MTLNFSSLQFVVDHFFSFDAHDEYFHLLMIVDFTKNIAISSSDIDFLEK